MKAIIQRVSSASVTTVDQYLKESSPVGEIDKGLVVFLGIERNDDEEQAAWMAYKVAQMRIFPDPVDDRMNLSVRDVRGGVLAIPNFTICGDCRHGRRPDFTGAARPEIADPLFQSFLQSLKDQEVARIQAGVFGADMNVKVVNDGPVSLYLESPER